MGLAWRSTFLAGAKGWLQRYRVCGVGVAVRQLIVEFFELVTSYPVAHNENIIVNWFKYAGMSRGGVSAEFWSDRASPILIQRYESSP